MVLCRTRVIKSLSTALFSDLNNLGRLLDKSLFYSRLRPNTGLASSLNLLCIIKVKPEVSNPYTNYPRVSNP